MIRAASVLALAGLWAAAASVPTSRLSAQQPALGPADGHDLPGADLERVSVGDEAPLFALESFDGTTIELAGFRGEKNVVLVFYRGHW